MTEGRPTPRVESPEAKKKKIKITTMLAEFQRNMPALMEVVSEKELDKTIARLRQVGNIGVDENSPWANK